ncbi:precorrin-3B C(17)-methyltransferase [Streptomyces sp. NBC_01498]|uniref:precorrin-3B C(17)-methyltransferase n=1 Tax=Streptomyces sp. NBC_01498 TaxID=2975870 RepID=UPI002E7AF5EB|nr:precorrin-3B C(17)-methyltransferase [Streptomyces sp. NBC_01498]WTL27501.1 precorrin-3B C(17)-methyltransferase [Streptomyces sp. NBC_01498]
MIGLISATAAGASARDRLATAWPARTRVYDGPVREAVERAFAECEQLVCFLATGATVRLLAPLLAGKATDPGVVCVDEAGRYAVSLLGGHGGGANSLAAEVGSVLAAAPVITTATDATGIPGLDTLGLPVEGAVAAVTRAMLDGARVTLRADAVWPLPPLPPNVVPEGPTGAAAGTANALRGAAASLNGPAGPDAPPGNAHQDATAAARGASGPQEPDEPGTAAAPQAPSTARATDAAPGTATAGTVVTAGHAPARHTPAGSTTDPHVAALHVTDRVVPLGPADAVLRPPSLVVGVGASRGAGVDEVYGLVRDALRAAGLSPLSVAGWATVDAKADEPGVVGAAARFGVPLRTYPAEVLASIAVPNPSDAPLAAVGTPSVAEAAALAAAGPGGELLVPKRKSHPEGRAAMATCAVVRRVPRGRLAVVGLGPGARDLLTPRATRELRRASVLVGLDQYVDQIRDLLRPGTRVIESGLGHEEERARTAVREARTGHAVALVGSGDAGVYAMASPALAEAADDIDVVGVPGVTAALAAAAILGAPLGHDHVSISLSDLHTPWEVIERRVRAAAEADIVVTFYNPRSRGRDWQLPTALALLAEHRTPGTPVGVVRNASRPDGTSHLTTLARLDPTTVDMMTVVTVGNTATREIAGRMVTPRGYRWQSEGAR